MRRQPMVTSHSYNLESHPGRLLIDHLKSVGDRVEEILSSKSFTEDAFKSMGYLYGVCHDFAKSTTFFQKYLRDPKHRRTILSRHGLTSAVFTYLAALHMSKDRKYAVHGYLTIVHHHGNLKNFIGVGGEQDTLYDSENMELILRQAKDILSNNLQKVEEIYGILLPTLPVAEIIHSMSEKETLERTLKDIRNDIDELAEKNMLENYVDEILFFSTINDSDKLHASRTEIPSRCKIPENLITEYKKGFEKNNINRFRSEACDEALNTLGTKTNLNQVFTLTLPTGMGKTLTGLEVALEIRRRIELEKCYTPKIIYSLPFLSIIEQSAEIIEDMLLKNMDATQRDEIPSNLFLKHHHLTEDIYSTENMEWEEDGSDLLTTAWYSELVVTTFHQLFHTLITNKNRMSRKFHNILDSVIILDEIQALPYRYWRLFEEIILMLVDKYGCSVILMTATQPLLFQGKSTELMKDTRKYYHNLDRVEYRFNPEEIDVNEYARDILPQKVACGESMMFVVNTIKSSNMLYNA
ncbi:MAG TPA: CRISPR-associated endonuclease Cas3'', partial [bacterium]|nr:CRISPR-associated endonuclease Cas3'' [bacterium]